MADYDAIVIGAGNNGLAAATIMAKHGLKTVCLEKTEYIGGLASNVSWWPGYTHNTGAYAIFDAKKETWDELELFEHGLDMTQVPVYMVGVSSLDKPEFMVMHDQKEMIQHIAQDIGPDWAAGWQGFMQAMMPFAIGMGQAIFNPPISIGQIIDSMPSIQGKDAMRKLFFGSIWDLYETYFPQDNNRGDALLGFLGMMGCDGIWGGPRTPGTSFNLSFHLTQGSEVSGGMVKGGIGKYSETIARSFKAKKGELCLNAPVKKLLLEKGKAVGVELENGEKITAKVVLSNADATVSYLRFIGEENLDADVVRMIKSIQYRNPFIQVFLKLDGLPEYTGRFSNFVKNGNPVGAIVNLTKNLQAAEDAWDACKNGRVPTEPNCMAHFHAFLDPSLAPAGKTTCTMFAEAFPIAAPRSQWDTLKEQYADVCIDRLAEFVPNIKDLIADRIVWSPADYERVFNNTNGCFDHGTFCIEQMLDNRPIPGWAEWATPIKGFYLCGSASHPGWGVTSLPGVNGAKRALRDLGMI